MTGNAYYITTAIAYPNGEPHIGHAYELIATDAIVRALRTGEPAGTVTWLPDRVTGAAFSTTSPPR